MVAVVEGYHPLIVDELDDVGEQGDFAPRQHGEADLGFTQLFIEAPHCPAQVVRFDEIVKIR